MFCPCCEQELKSDDGYYICSCGFETAEYQEENYPPEDDIPPPNSPDDYLEG